MGVEVGLQDAAAGAAGGAPRAGRCRVPRRGGAPRARRSGARLDVGAQAAAPVRLAVAPPRAPCGACCCRRRRRRRARVLAQAPCRCWCRRWSQPRARASGAWRRRIAHAGNLDADQLGADGQHLPDLAAEGQHAAGHRRRDLDAGLVGHHVGQGLVFGDRVAGLDMPGDELDLGDAFADIGHLDHVHVAGHLVMPPSRAAAPRRRAPGPGSRPIPAHAGRACPSR